MAIAARANSGKGHDDRLGVFEYLDVMAQDVERRLARKPVSVHDPWREFVRKVARRCRDVGLNPTATGRAYDPGKIKLTWFQNFMAALQNELLGRDGKQTNSPKAFAAEIARALRGDKKLGKARKQITGNAREA